MARKPAKPAQPSAVRSSSKRAAAGTPTRRSKRAKAAAKNAYVEPDSDDDGQPSGLPSVGDAGSAKESDFENPSDRDVSSESGHAGEGSDDEAPLAKDRGRPAKRASLPLHKKHPDEKELLKPGAKLEPGTRLVIKKPKPRGPGKTPYSDDTIHPNTMLFLEDLAANNDRQWLKLHDPDYRAALADFTTFLEKLSEKIIEADETIPELPVKDIIFRIYRDVRFSKDQTPYKTHFSAAWSRTGRKGPYAAYYVQIQPGGQSFVGGGLWQPDAEPLSKIRQSIDRKPHQIKSVLNDAGIRKEFLGDIADDEREAVKAFTNQPSNRSTALKKHPKGYENDHKDIELLRLRNFALGTKLADSEVVGSTGLERMAALCARLVPFITHLNSVVMPDSTSSDSSEGEESEGLGEGGVGEEDG